MEQNQDQTNEVEQNYPVKKIHRIRVIPKKPSRAQRIRSAIFELLVYVAIIVVCVMVVPRYVIRAYDRGWYLYGGDTAGSG